jgi:outer membrane PBP1 activator LpoA protein
MSRLNAILLIAIVSWIGPAFPDDAPSGTTTRARIVGNPAAPARDAEDASGTRSTTRATIIGPQPPAHADDIDPATGVSRSSEVRPLRDASPLPDRRTDVPRTPGAPKPFVALILPTGAPALARLADAVRQGFETAAGTEGRNGPAVSLTSIDNEAGALTDACRKVQEAGAILVVAAITRDGATAFAHSDCARNPALLLNEPQLQASDSLPNLFFVSLSLENDARQVAQMAVADGARLAAVVSSGSPLAKRVQEAFEREWTRAAGELKRVPYSGNPEDAPAVRDRVNASRADMVFFALDANDARTVRPYIPATLNLYATAFSVNPRAEAIVNVDLQGLRYLEMPWFVQPDHPAVMAYAAPKSAMSVDEERLYAFGIDAYRLSLHLLRGDARRGPLDGVTGKLALEPNNGFARTLTPTEVDGGHVIPLRAP